MVNLILFFAKFVIAFVVLSVVFLIYPINSTIEPFRTCNILFLQYATAREIDYLPIIAEIHLLPFKVVLKLDAVDASFLGYQNNLSMCNSNVPIFASGALWGFLFWIMSAASNTFKSKSNTQKWSHKKNIFTRMPSQSPSISVDFSNHLACHYVEIGFKVTEKTTNHTKRQIQKAINYFFSKYPVALLEKCVTRIVVVGKLEINHITMGGFAFRPRREIVLSANEQRFSQTVPILHHELAHLILWEYPFNKEPWLALAKEARIKYIFDSAGSHTAQCDKNSKQNLQHFLENGFLHEYATTCFEEDFCAFADHLFSNTENLLSLQKYRLIRLKTLLIIEYYSNLGVELPTEFSSLK